MLLEAQLGITVLAFCCLFVFLKCNYTSITLWRTIITWKLAFDLLSLERRSRVALIPCIIGPYSIFHLSSSGIFTNDQLAFSWVYSACNMCEVICCSGTSEYSSLSADDSWCQPLYLSIPIYTVFWRYLQRQVAVIVTEITTLAEATERLVQCSSADSRMIASTWFPHEIQQEHQITSLLFPVSLIDYLIFQIKLCCCFVFLFFSKTDRTLWPSCFPETI